MSAPVTGRPCRYELGTSDLVAAGTFYGGALDWTVTGSRVTEIPYTLAISRGVAVAGLMLAHNQTGEPPPSWIPHFATDDCAATAAAITAAGGDILRPPSEAPGIGVFAIASDPGGAVFGVTQMDAGQVEDAVQHARRNWHELMSNDTSSALAFYEAVFGWTTGDAHDVEHVGTAQTIHAGDDAIGTVMAIAPNAPTSVWLTYFGVDDLPETLRRIGLTGGNVMHGPADAPDGRQIAVAAAPQGAWFAVIGAAARENTSRAIPLRMA